MHICKYVKYNEISKCRARECTGVIINIEDKENTKKERGNEKMQKQLVIAEWWLSKNPAQEVIINEFEEIEITKETEKAYLLNEKVWVPKSAASFEEITEEEISKDKVREAFSNLETSQRIRIRREASKKFKNNEDYSGNIYEDVRFYNYLAEEMKINGYDIN